MWGWAGRSIGANIQGDTKPFAEVRTLSKRPPSALSLNSYIIDINSVNGKNDELMLASSSFGLFRGKVFFLSDSLMNCWSRYFVVALRLKKPYSGSCV